MSENKKRLPDSELEVMQALWDCPSPVQRAQIEARMQETHPIAQTTLLTLLGRLAEKGFVESRKEGRSSVYIPLVSREEYLADQSRRFVDQLCKGSVSMFAAALCDSGLSKEDIKELRELLKRGEL